MAYFEDSESVIGKKYYDVAIMNRVSDDDFESVNIDGADNYRQAVRIAKKLSLKRDAIDIVCYTPTIHTSYHTLWFERYINGKKQYRCEI